MPTYLYRDANAHEAEIVMTMTLAAADPVITCGQCRAIMKRVPQVPRVNYGGDTAAHPIHPAIKQLIDEAPQRRDKFAREHEEHERRTANEKAG